MSAGHTPIACQLTCATFDSLEAGIATAEPDARTGAAFVNLDTRVLAALISPAHRTAPELLWALKYVLRQLADGDNPELDKDGDEIDPFERARAVVAKAEGRP